MSPQVTTQQLQDMAHRRAQLEEENALHKVHAEDLEEKIEKLQATIENGRQQDEGVHAEREQRMLREAAAAATLTAVIEALERLLGCVSEAAYPAEVAQARAALESIVPPRHPGKPERRPRRRRTLPPEPTPGPEVH